MVNSASRCPVHFTPDFICPGHDRGSARDGQMKYFTLAGRHHSSLHCRLRVRAFVGAATAALAGCIAFAAGLLGAALRDGPFRPERDQSPAGAGPVIGPIVAGLTAGGMQ